MRPAAAARAALANVADLVMGVPLSKSGTTVQRFRARVWPSQAERILSEPFIFVHIALPLSREDAVPPMKPARRHRSAQRSPDRPARPSGPPVELTIEAVGGEGDGVAAGPAFVPFTLPGERVLARGGGERRELAQVLAPSADRIEPACPHFGTCGGCALQHWAHEPYLAWKVARLAGTLARQRIETDILAPFAAGPGTRRRVALHARRGSREAAKLG